MFVFTKLHRNSCAYAVISLASGMMNSVFFFYYVSFFLNRYKIEEWWFQVGQTLFLIWNAINDPLFGYWQDNFQGECFKTRRHAVLYGAFLWAFSFLLPWFPWTSDPANTVIVGLHLIVSLFMYDAMLTSVLLAQCAIFTEMSKKTEDRVRLVRYSQVASLIGHGSVFVCEFVSHNLEHFRAFQITCVVIAVLAWLLLRYAGQNVMTEYDYAAKVEKGSENGELSVNPGTGGLGIPAYLQLTWQVLRNWNFICFVLVNFLTTFQSTYNTNFSRIICNHLIPDADLSSFFRSLLYGSFMVVPQITVILGSSLVANLGYFRIIRWTFALQILSALFMYFMGRSHTWLLALFFVVKSVLPRSAFSLSNLPLSDIIEEDRIQYGRSHPVSATVYGTNALITKPASSFPAMLAVMVFNQYGYKELAAGKMTEGPQTEHLFDTMFLLTCAMPVIVGIFQYIIWSMYKIRNSHINQA